MLKNGITRTGFVVCCERVLSFVYLNMIETIAFKEKIYPKFQSEGNAARFAIPFAEAVCKGIGYDIGCNKKEWAFPGAFMIDPTIDNRFDAMNLPGHLVDYIFSSHCLEHVEHWVKVLDYWFDNLKKGGTLFLYLPDFSQVYWRGWHNRKHCNMFTPEIIKEYFLDQSEKWENVFVSGVDLNNSFMVMAQKK